MSSRETANAASRRPTKRCATELYVEHGHYYVTNVEGSVPVPHGTGLVEGRLLYPAPEGDEDGGAFIWTGTLYGCIAITVEIYDSAEEAVPDDGDWEFREEARIVARAPNLRIETESGVEAELPQLDLAPGEAAGIRLHTRGFREAAEIQELTGPDDDPVEFHLLQLWRA